MTHVDVKWTVVRKEGKTFVVETFAGSVSEFGPMPPDFAGPFVDERMEFYEHTAKREMDRLKKHTR